MPKKDSNDGSIQYLWHSSWNLDNGTYTSDYIDLSSSSNDGLKAATILGTGTPEANEPATGLRHC